MDVESAAELRLRATAALPEGAAPEAEAEMGFGTLTMAGAGCGGRNKFNKRATIRPKFGEGA
jgi:hypothetical protein